MARTVSCTPRLTVAMAVYNNAPYLAEAIDSILAQEFADFEFLIVNDGSTDGSGALIDARAASDARIRVIHQTNRGLIASLNMLLHEAAAPWIARMDGDDICQPQRLGRQIDFIDRSPGYGVVGTNGYLIGPDSQRLAKDGGAKPVTHEQAMANLEDKPLFHHPSVIMQRDLVLELGGYHPAYRFCEDHDLWLRLADRTRFANLPEELIAYRVYPDQVSCRHIVEQACNAAIAWQARVERLAGRPDPTEGLAQLPPLAEIDQLFGRKGVADYVRRRVVEHILYNPDALAGDGYAMALDFIANCGGDETLWRASARLLRAGHPRAAAGMALALAKAG